jgi:hypothetical protein
MKFTMTEISRQTKAHGWQVRQRILCIRIVPFPLIRLQ